MINKNKQSDGYHRDNPNSPNNPNLVESVRSGGLSKQNICTYIHTYIHTYINDINKQHRKITTYHKYNNVGRYIKADRMRDMSAYQHPWH